MEIELLQFRDQAVPDVPNEQNHRTSGKQDHYDKRSDYVKFRGPKQAQNVGQKCQKIIGSVHVRLELRPKGD